MKSRQVTRKCRQAGIARIRHFRISRYHSSVMSAPAPAVLFMDRNGTRIGDARYLDSFGRLGTAGGIRVRTDCGRSAEARPRPAVSGARVADDQTDGAGLIARLDR
jgi:hypothetical protein